MGNGMDKTVIVVGANGEIGSSLVRAIAKTHQVILWVSPRANVDLVREHLNLRSESLVLPVDLCDQSEIKKTFIDTRARFPDIDAVITCSGIATGAHSLMTTERHLTDSWNINFLAPTLITQMVAKSMLRKKCGKIIHLASIQGLIAEPGNLAYGCSKAALVHACKIFAQELGPHGIAVNAVCPTVLHSKMGDLMDEASKQRLLEYSSNNGLAIKIDEVIALIEFLLKVEGTAINGQALRVDAGMPF